VSDLDAPRRSAILLATDGEGRVLLVRQRGGPFKHAWLLPGGGLEPGETFRDALAREVREETCLDVSDAREVVRYDVRGSGSAPFHLRVHMYRGTVSGDPRPGADNEPVSWMRVDPAAAHPVLVRQLRDAGVLDVEIADVDERCRDAGITMTLAADGTSG